MTKLRISEEGVQSSQMILKPNLNPVENSQTARAEGPLVSKLWLPNSTPPTQQGVKGPPRSPEKGRD